MTDSTGPFNVEQMIEELGADRLEESLLNQAQSARPYDANVSRALLNIYTVKRLSSAVDKMIESNEMLERSNDRYARAMNLLTGGLLLVAIIQVILL